MVTVKRLGAADVAIFDKVTVRRLGAADAAMFDKVTVRRLGVVDVAMFDTSILLLQDRKARSSWCGCPMFDMSQADTFH